MATKKQRKRKEKEQRHEYVWVDAEGNELDQERVPSKESTAAAATARPGRTPQPPSWRKAFKRGAIFGPIMLATVMLISGKLTFAEQVTQTLFIVAVFIPFSYFLDRVMYRSFQKRQARPTRAGSRSRS